MSETLPQPLVSTEWLAANLGKASLRILDGSFFLPTAKRDGTAEYRAAHIPGAIRFDIDQISDPRSDLPHMLPSVTMFATMVGAMGIENDHAVVVYDDGSAAGSARVWWTFRVFGHDRISVLDGGLHKWRAEGRPEEAVAPVYPATTFHARLRPELVRDRNAMLANIDTKSDQVLDARSRGRFAGTDPEPRQGLRGGHIPGSANLPSVELIDPETRTMRPDEKLHQMISETGIDLHKPIATTCGSGVTASTLSLALYKLGQTDVAVYDGSWSEWGRDPELPVAP